MDEHQLVKAILKDEKRAVESFFKKFSPSLKGVIAAKVGDLQDQEELLQETFISAFQSLPMFKFQSKLSSWLLGIARHEIADFYRKKKIKTIFFSHLPFLENLIDQALGPEEAMVEKEVKQKVGKVFNSLTEGYRTILRLKYLEGLSVAEIAYRLNLSLKAVESKLTRARLAFRETWLENAETIFSKKPCRQPLR